MKTIKVKIKKYHLDITSEPETKEYKELTEKLNKADLQFFNVLSFQKGNDIPEGWHEIDTDFLFSNQYNTKSGFRIFEWYEIIHENKNIKEGYYISKGMDKLREAQKSQGICGYCGARYNLNEQPKQTWCDKCLDSEFLTENDLCLLRILPVYPEPRRITLIPDNIKELWKEKKKIGDKNLFMFEADESREFLTGVYSLVKKDMETQDMDAARWQCLNSATMYGKGFLRDLCKFVAETDDPATANDFIIKILDLTT
jgi:hypothetical protein